MAFQVALTPVGEGQFSVAADRNRLGEVLKRMLRRKIAGCLVEADFHEYRLQRNFQRVYFRNFPIGPIDDFSARVCLPTLVIQHPSWWQPTCTRMASDSMPGSIFVWPQFPSAKAVCFLVPKPKLKGKCRSSTWKGPFQTANPVLRTEDPYTSEASRAGRPFASLLACSRVQGLGSCSLAIDPRPSNQLLDSKRFFDFWDGVVESSVNWPFPNLRCFKSQTRNASMLKEFR